MTWRGLSGRDRRAIVGAALVLVPLLLWRGLFVPLSAELGARGAELEEERRQFAREAHLVASADRYGVAVARGGDLLLETARRRFPSENGATALEAWVRATLERAGLRIESVSVVPAADDSDAEPVRTITVQLEATGDLEGVLYALQAFDSGVKLIQADELRVSRTAYGDIEPDVPEELRLEALVSGYSLAGETPSSGGAERGPDSS